MRKRLLIGCVALSLLGCQVWPLKATLPAFRPEVPQFHKGTLSLRIKWPDRDRPGFHAAAIPLTTQAIAIRVKQGGMLLAQQVLTRTPGSSEATASFTLDAANNLTVEVRAYRESNPDMVNGVAIAQGMATGVNVVPSKNGSLAIVLDARFVPSITGMSGNVGQVGDSVTLTGTNFGTGSLPVSVAFNGTPTTITSRGTDSVTVTVPTGATTGQVVVASKGDWDPSPANSRVVPFGARLTFSATPSFVFRMGDSTTNMGPPPSPSWQTSGGAAVIDAFGILTAGTTYASCSVTARLGPLTSPAIQALVEDVQLVTSTATVSLGYGLDASDSVQLTAYNRFSDGSTSPTVQYAAVDPASVSVTPDGRLSYLAGVGVSVVTVTSAADSRRAARIPLLLKTYRVIRLVMPIGGQPAPLGNLAAVTAYDPTHVYGLETLSGSVRDLLGGNLLWGMATGFWCNTGEVNYLNHHHLTGLSVDRQGRVFLCDLDEGSVCPVATDSAAVTLQRKWPNLAFLPDNTPVALDLARHRVIKLNHQFDFQASLAGDGQARIVDGPGASASFAFDPMLPVDIRCDRLGNVYVLDSDSGWRKVYPDGRVETLPGHGSTRYGLVKAFGPQGEQFVLGPNNVAVLGTNGGGVNLVFAGGPDLPEEGLFPRVAGPQDSWQGLTCDYAGNLVVWGRSNFSSLGPVRMLVPVP